MRLGAGKSTTVALEGAGLEEARQLGINISSAAEGGVIAAIRAERSRTWGQENAGAIADYNAFVEANGSFLGGIPQGLSQGDPVLSLSHGEVTDPIRLTAVRGSRHCENLLAGL